MSSIHVLIKPSLEQQQAADGRRENEAPGSQQVNILPGGDPPRDGSSPCPFPVLAAGCARQALLTCVGRGRAGACMTEGSVRNVFG